MKDKHWALLGKIWVCVVILGVAYSYAAPVRIDNPEMAQKRYARALLSQIDSISNLADAKIYLRKLTKLVAMIE